MLATERLLEIEETFGEQVRSIVPLELDGEALRLILYLKDSTRICESPNNGRGRHSGVTVTIGSLLQTI